MATRLLVRDELTTGGPTEELTLDFLTEHITVAELIRGRVYQEVTELNAARARAPRHRLLVEPTETERQLNASVPRHARRLDWEEHYARALRAFARNGFVIIVDGQQVQDLETEIELRPETDVTFLRLVPLAGG
jgi:hypothetical protein